VGGVDIDDSARAVRDTSKRAARSTWVEGMARYGLVAKGVSYGLVGALAIAVVVAGSGKTTSREGALALVADETYGPFLLGMFSLVEARYRHV
jgi:hypothetical protein